MWSDVLAAILRDSCDVEVSTDLHKAKQLIQHSRPSFHVVVVDIQLTDDPDVDLNMKEHTLLEQIRIRGAYTKVVLLISHGPTEEQIENIVKKYQISYQIRKQTELESLNHKKFRELIQKIAREAGWKGDEECKVPKQEENEKLFAAESTFEAEVSGEFSMTTTPAGNEQRLRQQITDLEEQWRLLNQKLSKLRKQRAIETRPEEDFRLENLIAETENECNQVDEHLQNLEGQLSKWCLDGANGANNAQSHEKYRYDVTLQRENYGRIYQMGG